MSRKSTKSPKKGSNLICRVANINPENVCGYVHQLPKCEMSVETFRQKMGPEWFQNIHQAPEQWGLYYIDDQLYHPRFTRDISLEEAKEYIQGWMKRTIVINPYTRFKTINDKPLISSIVDYMEQNPDESDLKTIIKGFIGTDEPFVINEILTNALTTYSQYIKVTAIDKANEIYNVEFTKDYYTLKNSTNMTKEEYFHLFDNMELDKAPLQTIYYGAPGTGKSHEVKILTGELDVAGNEHEKPNVFRTTFHPDTDYASFVGCYKPTMKPVIEKYRAVAGKEEDIVYEFVPQAFTDAYIYAYNHEDIQTYLVIEEINRGNCAQIFGDLFQLLDRKADGTSEYTIKADKDLANYLTAKLGEDSEGIADGKLRLPKNLNILATMNTSDQSLFPMDSAFKRRWDWKYVAISYTEPKSSAFMIKIKEQEYNWVDFIQQVNARILSLTQSEDKQLGNFFIKNSIDAEQFKSKVMFYLWYEVLRDEVENNKYFFHYLAQEEGAEKEKPLKFTFKDLYSDKADEILEGFLKYLNKKAE